MCYFPSFILLFLALKRIDISVAYAIWSGVGTATITIIGALWFHERHETGFNPVDYSGCDWLNLGSGVK